MHLTNLTFGPLTLNKCMLPTDLFTLTMCMLPMIPAFTLNVHLTHMRKEGHSTFDPEMQRLAFRVEDHQQHTASRKFSKRYIMYIN